MDNAFRFLFILSLSLTLPVSLLLSYSSRDERRIQGASRGFFNFALPSTKENNVVFICIRNEISGVEFERPKEEGCMKAALTPLTMSIFVYIFRVLFFSNN